MGRKFFIVTTFLLVGAEIAVAQGAARRGRGPGFGRNPNFTHPNQNFRPAPDRSLQLSPEDRQMLRKNAERWLKMDPQQRQLLRDREQLRRQQMQLEVDAAIRQSGLRLDQKSREQYESRYFQERRKIERELRQEFESKRQQELPQLNERLKKEFQSPQGSSGSPAASASPGK